MRGEIVMPAPRFVAKINRRVTNPVARRFAGRIPPFATMTHRGRKSGTFYQTPIMAFPTGDGFLIALTYGSETDWVRNVIAQGGGTIEYRRQEISLSEPRLITSNPAQMPLPGLVRRVLRLLNVTEFLSLRRKDTITPPANRASGDPAAAE
jgi:deazaflavin-dependent oxidoreductase (nitroreductase family)